jgi:hypothetical protein
MLYKTFKSYDQNQPYEEEQEHPDGPLWLITPEELRRLPGTMWLETTFGKVVRADEVAKKKSMFIRDNSYMNVGVRGRHD